MRKGERIFGVEKKGGFKQHNNYQVGQHDIVIIYSEEDFLQKQVCFTIDGVASSRAHILKPPCHGIKVFGARCRFNFVWCPH